MSVIFIARLSRNNSLQLIARPVLRRNLPLWTLPDRGCILQKKIARIPRFIKLQ